jgi:hypothetical protein
MTFSIRSQIALVWWSLVLAIVFGLAFGFFLHMIPPPRASMSAEQIKSWYLSRDGEIKIGAMIASWTSAFMVPLFVVIGAQMRRVETGFPIWTMATIVGGGLTSVLLVIPPIIFGAAAFHADRAADATASIHDLGVLMLVTTDQYFIFPWVAIIVTCLRPGSPANWPFPRWFGYLNIWFVGLAELGAIAYNFDTGVFSWRGLFPYWLPFGLFGGWVILTSVLLLRALKAQLADELAVPALEGMPVAVGV